MSWKDIPTAEVSEFAPVTARVMRKLRNNTRAIADIWLDSDLVADNNSTTSSTFVELITVRLWIPDRVIGSAGVLIEPYTSLQAVEGSTPPNAICRAYWAVGSDQGTQEVVTPSTYFSGFMELTLDETTTEGYVDLELWGRTNSTNHTLYVTLLRELKLTAVDS